MNDCLPPVLNDLTDIIGGDTLMTLLAHYEGQRIYVPDKPGPEHWLTATIGQDNATRLAEAYGGQSIELPMLTASRVRLKHHLIAQDAQTMSHAQLVAKWKLCRRQIINILNKHKRREPAPQTDLFEENRSENAIRHDQ